MKYCIRCLYPNTKPDLTFNKEGLCSACMAFDRRKTIDWDQRAAQFKSLVRDVKHLEREYDCIVPVSGGKDSTYQVLQCLKYGLKPLAVTARTDMISRLGRENLDNIAQLGVDHIEVTPNQRVRRRICRYTLETIGDISWPEHVLIFTIPVQEALRRKIPLIIWGENPQHEYGGPIKHQDASDMTARWLQEFGGLNGLRVRDIVDEGIAQQIDMGCYVYPDTTSPFNTVRQVFLGQFFQWDGLENARIAECNGFMPYLYDLESCGYDYENLDNYATGIHDHFKWLKFGFSRSTDMVSSHIRRGRITRIEGIEHVGKFDPAFPDTYLGQGLDTTLKYFDLTIEDYIGITKQFANKKLFDVSKMSMASPQPTMKFTIGQND